MCPDTGCPAIFRADGSDVRRAVAQGHNPVMHDRKEVPSCDFRLVSETREDAVLNILLQSRLAVRPHVFQDVRFFTDHHVPLVVPLQLLVLVKPYPSRQPHPSSPRDDTICASIRQRLSDRPVVNDLVAVRDLVDIVVLISSRGCPGLRRRDFDAHHGGVGSEFFLSGKHRIKEKSDEVFWLLYNGEPE